MRVNNDYPIYCSMSVVTTDHTSHARYQQVIRGLNTHIVVNRVLSNIPVILLSHVLSHKVDLVTRTINQSYERLIGHIKNV